MKYASDFTGEGGTRGRKNLSGGENSMVSKQGPAQADSFVSDAMAVF